jgi:hypothetical protein
LRVPHLLRGVAGEPKAIFAGALLSQTHAVAESSFTTLCPPPSLEEQADQVPNGSKDRGCSIFDEVLLAPKDVFAGELLS